MRLTEDEYERIRARRDQRDAESRARHVARQAVAPAPKAKPIIRQSTKEPNKTEQRFFLDKLAPWEAMGELDEIGDHESIVLKLANGLTLRPDWPTWKSDKLTFYEVKGGFIREDSIIKLKMAASKYPRFGFFLCQWKGGEWTIQEVRP